MFCHLRVLKKLAEPEEEEEEDDDGEDELMVPKVRVAEDGTLILDEERYETVTIRNLLISVPYMAC